MIRPAIAKDTVISQLDWNNTKIYIMIKQTVTHRAVEEQWNNCLQNALYHSITALFDISIRPRLDVHLSQPSAVCLDDSYCLGVSII